MTPTTPEVRRHVRLLDVASIPNGQVSPIREPYRSMTLIAPDDVESSTGRLVQRRSAAERRAISSKYMVRPGDVVYGKIRPELRKAVLAEEECLSSADMYPLRPSSVIDPQFLLLLVLSEEFTKFVVSACTRSGIPKVNRSDLSTYIFPLPSLAEQQRISSIVNSIDQKIKYGKYRCSKLQQVASGIAQDVLAVAVGDPRSGAQGEDRTVLPLRQLADITAGVTLGSEPSGPSSVELPYLRVANVQDGHIDTSEVKRVRVLRSQVDRYRLQSGDVLLTEGGDFDKLGRGAVWDGQIPVCLHQNHVFRVRPDDRRLSSEFLAMYTASPAGRQYFLGIAKQTTNLASINSTQLRQMPVPVPPREEQDRLMQPVREIRERLKAETAELAKLQLMKQGLTEDLLSGKVRVPA